MGDMAMMALHECEVYESLADDYVSGYMSSQGAYDNGFIDELGCESPSMQSAWDRAGIGSVNEINQGLKNAIQDFDLAARCRVPQESNLNDEALENLSKCNPACNICRDEMQAKTGKFGKFYYCGNSCKKQGTVSDKYWQSVRTWIV